MCAHGCRFTHSGPPSRPPKDGDTIRVGPGIYKGGLTIASTVSLVGSGKGSTTIRGGGPVLTIGTFGAPTEPTVSIRGVTITGGVSRSSPVSVPFFGEAGVFATGGGVEIPPSVDFGPGATVTISHSAILGNRVAPSRSVPGPPCPSGPCPAAAAGGGGIDNWGELTVIASTVSGNRVGAASGLSDIASDAIGGGILHWAGVLDLRDSTFEGNRVSASAPNGRFVEGGAIHLQDGDLTMSHDWSGTTALR